MHLRNLARLLAVVAVALSLTFSQIVSATADDEVEYENTEPVPGDPDDPGPNEPTGPPPCDTSAEFPVCFGPIACWVRDHALYDDPSELGPKPSDDAHISYRQCEDGSVEWYWTDEGGPSLADRIRSARGALVLPVFTATFNPPTRTLVNLPTWWWAAGLPAGEVVGTEALGLRAVATRRSMVVDPGDGSPVIRCPITTASSDACTTIYRHSSGRGTYPAVVTVMYDVRFEEDGQVIDVPPEIPADLLVLRASQNVNVRVVEVQSRVTRTS